MIRVWSDTLNAGLLDRDGARGAVFAYDPRAAPARAVSLTMPVRLASWNHAWGIHPIFEMNLPEGALRERLRLSFAKATGTFDAFDLLAVVGRSQIGRLRYTDAGASLDEEVPFQSVDEILRQRRDGDLFAHLMRRFAIHSGISGVQPKVMIRDGISVRGATHIVKFWDDDYPQLAANEFFCLRVAEKCGLEVPRVRLAESGAALVVDRFDLRADGTYRGVEDFCVLNARSAEEKYKGGYETALFKRMRDFVDGERLPDALERLFTLFVVNCLVRNGDAHLKNFALIYDDVGETPRLAPVYDVVTTTAYLPQDGMALTLGGSTRWPDAARLAALGTQRCALAPRQVAAILDRVATALAETAVEMRAYIAGHPEFAEIGGRMLDQWVRN